MLRSFLESSYLLIFKKHQILWIQFSDGKFLMLEEFQNKFNIKVNYLHYFQLVAAIPLDLKRKALDSPVPGLLSAPSEYFQLKDRTIALTKFRSKNYYKLFIDTEPPAIRSWKKQFPELPDWSSCFVDIYVFERC